MDLPPRAMRCEPVTKSGSPSAGGMVDNPRPVARPVELGGAWQVASQRAPHRRHRPDARSPAGRPPVSNVRSHEEHQRPIRRERDGAQVVVEQRLCAALRQVVELAGADLRDPHVRSVHPGPRERRRTCRPGIARPRVRHFRTGSGASTLASFSGSTTAGSRIASSETIAATASSAARSHQATVAGLPRAGSSRDSGRRPRWLLLEMQGAARPPRVELRAGAVHRTALRVQVPVNGHPFGLLPPLNGADVPLQVRGNRLPRPEMIIRPTRRRVFGPGWLGIHGCSGSARAGLNPVRAILIPHRDRRNQQHFAAVARTSPGAVSCRLSELVTGPMVPARRRSRRRRRST